MQKSNKRSLWEILVPRYSNDGTEYPVEYHRKWDEMVREIAGGITVLKPTKGQWISPEGELFNDEMIPVRIYCTEADIEKIIDYTLKYYDQKAIFAYEVSANVKIKRREE